MIRLGSWWRYLTSLRLALLLLIILTSIIALGSLFPSMPLNTATSPELREDWLQAAKDKYGFRTELYDALGLFEIYHSVWFWALLGGTAFITMACVLSRWHIIRSLFRLERSAWSRSGSVFAHLGGVLLILGAGWSIWGGWRINSVILPPDEPVEISSQWPYALLSKTVTVESEPGIRDDYRAEVSVLSGDRTLATHELRVNHPLFFDGQGFYLKSYGPALTLSAIDENGDQLTMQLPEEEHTAAGQVTLLLRPGETTEITLPDLKIDLHLATSSRAEPSQREGYFVKATNQSGKTIGAGVILPGKDFEIAGGTFRLEKENYVEIQVVHDPGFWPAIAGGMLILLGTILTIGRNGRRDTNDEQTL